MMPNKGGAVSDDGSSTGGSDGTVLKKGPWTAAEDSILMEYVKKHGEGNWNAVQKNSGLSRCGKSCRLRWANHLRPNLKKGSFSPDEERLILELHAKLGNKWARMAAQLPGRTDNEIKNYWNTRVKRRQRAGLPLYPQDVQKQPTTFQLHPNHQPCPSLSPTPIPLSSSQQQRLNFGSPLPQFDSMNFSTTSLLGHHNNTPFLPMPVHDLKRFRGNNCGFSKPFSSPTSTLPSSSSLFNQNFTTQLLPTPSLQFNSGNYDLNSTSMARTHFEPNVTAPPSSAFSMKFELPSYQLPQSATNIVASSSMNNYRMLPSLARSNSGLLDALLQEAEAMGGGENVRREELIPFQEEKVGVDGFIGQAPPSKSFFSESPTTQPLGHASQWDDSSSAHSSIGLKMKKEATIENHSMDDDDLSSLFDIIPSSMLVGNLYNEAGEISNGQSSVVTDEDNGLDMQQPPSSLSVTTTTTTTTTADHNWTLGAWNHVPNMC